MDSDTTRLYGFMVDRASMALFGLFTLLSAGLAAIVYENSGRSDLDGVAYGSGALFLVLVIGVDILSKKRAASHSAASASEQIIRTLHDRSIFLYYAVAGASAGALLGSIYQRQDTHQSWPEGDGDMAHLALAIGAPLFVFASGGLMNWFWGLISGGRSMLGVGLGVLSILGSFWTAYGALGFSENLAGMGAGLEIDQESGILAIVGYLLALAWALHGVAWLFGVRVLMGEESASTSSLRGFAQWLGRAWYALALAQGVAVVGVLIAAKSDLGELLSHASQLQGILAPSGLPIVVLLVLTGIAVGKISQVEAPDTTTEP